MKEKNFWFGKRVLVTGADGFVAAHLIKRLLNEGSVVVANVRHKRPISSLSTLWEEGEKELVPDLESFDLLNFAEVRRVCDRHQIDTIFHLAASAIVSSSANSPMSTIENNVITTLNLLEAARVSNIPRFILASTDKAYGDHAEDPNESLPYRESYALRGLDVYSSSKLCADMIAQTYVYQYKLPVMICRSSNIYGPGDLNFTRLIPRTAMRLMAGKAPVINIGNENVLREYVYIDDVINAYILLAEKIESYYGENNSNIPTHGVATHGWAAFNVGSYVSNDLKDISKCESIRSVKDVINLLCSKIGNLEAQTIPKPSNFIEIPDQYIDATKLHNLGFKTKVKFEDGINRTIAWYKKNQEKIDTLATKYLK